MDNKLLFPLFFSCFVELRFSAFACTCNNSNPLAAFPNALLLVVVVAVEFAVGSKIILQLSRAVGRSINGERRYHEENGFFGDGLCGSSSAVGVCI